MAKIQTNRSKNINTNFISRIEDDIEFKAEDVAKVKAPVLEVKKEDPNIPDTKDIFIKKDMGDSWKYITKDGRKIIIKK